MRQVQLSSFPWYKREKWVFKSKSFTKVHIKSKWIIGRKLRFPGSPGHYCVRRWWTWSLAFRVWTSFLELVHSLGDTMLVASKHQDVYSHRPGGQESRMQVSAEPVPPCWGRTCAGQILGAPWLVDSRPQLSPRRHHTGPSLASRSPPLFS